MDKHWLDEQLLAAMDRKCRVARQKNTTCTNLDCGKACACHWRTRGIPEDRVLTLAEQDSLQYEQALVLIDHINQSQQRLVSLLTLMGV